MILLIVFGILALVGIACNFYIKTNKFWWKKLTDFGDLEYDGTLFEDSIKSETAVKRRPFLNLENLPI